MKDKHASAAHAGIFAATTLASAFGLLVTASEVYAEDIFLPNYNCCWTVGGNIGCEYLEGECIPVSVCVPQQGKCAVWVASTTEEDTYWACEFRSGC
jgi:hypothetical protein